MNDLEPLHYSIRQEIEDIFRVTAILQGMSEDDFPKYFRDLVATKRKELCSTCVRGEMQISWEYLQSGNQNMDYVQGCSGHLLPFMSDGKDCPYWKLKLNEEPKHNPFYEGET